MRRSDAARGEHVIEPRRQRAHAVRDLLGHVGHDLDPAQRDPQGAKLPRQKARVLVLDLARQDLVPDEQDGGGRVGGGHGRLKDGQRQIIVTAGPWHNGSNLKTVLGLLLLLPVALAGCRSDMAGIKPGTDDGGVDQTGKLPKPDANCPADAAGGGQCPINFCGQAKVGLPANQYPQSGADSLCGVRSCKVGPELSTGDGFQLVCFDPNQSALAFGADCSPDPALGMRCADETLCIAAPGSSGGPFCSRMCRNDADCPSGARCLEVPTPVALADGRRPVIGMCTPRIEDRRHGVRARGRLRRGSGLRQLRRAHQPAHLPGGGREVARNSLRRPRRVPQRSSASTGTGTSGRPEPRLLLGRLQRQQRLRPRSALHAAGRRQQRSRRAIRSTIW